MTSSRHIRLNNMTSMSDTLSDKISKKQAVDDLQKRSIEEEQVYPRPEERDSRITAFSPKEQKSIIKRVDFRLVLTLGLLYMICAIDRSNLGSAGIAGMLQDLDMNASNNAYSIVSFLFFIPSALFQPPATIVLRKSGPRIFLGSTAVCWGIVVIACGFVKTWHILAVLRVFLGILEAGVYPGSAYLLSTWYTRYELQKRYAVFYLIGIMASAFSGILAYGLTQLNGLAGLKGWRWIFIIEGIITCIVGLLSYIALVDFPENSSKSWRFLNKNEADFMVARIEVDRADVEAEPFDLGLYFHNGLDSKVWAFALMFTMTVANAAAISFFLPIILKNGMGFDVARSQCLMAPPFIAAAVAMYAQAHYGDKFHLRSPIIIGNAMLAIIGMVLLGYTTHNGTRYFGVFLSTVATNSNFPVILAYQSNNIRGQWKRALSTSLVIGAGAVGAIIGTTVFRPVDSPKYRPGILTCVLANAVILVTVGLLTVKFRRANKRAESGGKPIEGHVGFRYTY